MATLERPSHISVAYAIAARSTAAAARDPSYLHPFQESEPLRGTLPENLLISRVFELHRWFNPHFSRHGIQNREPTKSAFLKRFVCTTITTTLLTQSFLTTFNPWIASIFVFVHTLENRIVYTLFRKFADPSFRLHSTRDAQNYSLESFLHLITFVALGAITCASLHLRVTTFATYYLFVALSEQCTFGTLNVLAYFFPMETETAVQQEVHRIVRDIQRRSQTTEER